jgi:5-formyltetrahydrofolate cyclo-ligase
MDKIALRSKYKSLRDRLSSAEIEDLSLQIANRSLKLPIWDRTYYHIFLSINTKKEVHTEYLLHILQGKDKSIVVSKTDFEALNMRHFLLQDSTQLRSSKWGIPEPTHGIEVAPISLDVIFVPLLAYDERGHRIGYGKGFYDRFLSACRNDAVFVGLSFFDPEPNVPSEATDIPLHFAVTPTATYSFSNSSRETI